jgi:hypothetical protein
VEEHWFILGFPTKWAADALNIIECRVERLFAFDLGLPALVLLGHLGPNLFHHFGCLSVGGICREWAYVCEWVWVGVLAMAMALIRRGCRRKLALVRAHYLWCVSFGIELYSWHATCRASKKEEKKGGPRRWLEELTNPTHELWAWVGLDDVGWVHPNVEAEYQANIQRLHLAFPAPIHHTDGGCFRSGPHEIFRYAPWTSARSEKKTRGTAG